jgi:hypothetical protein
LGIRNDAEALPRAVSGRTREAVQTNTVSTGKEADEAAAQRVRNTSNVM